MLDSSTVSAPENKKNVIVKAWSEKLQRDVEFPLLSSSIINAPGNHRSDGGIVMMPIRDSSM